MTFNIKMIFKNYNALSYGFAYKKSIVDNREIISGGNKTSTSCAFNLISLEIIDSSGAVEPSYLAAVTRYHHNNKHLSSRQTLHR